MPRRAGRVESQRILLICTSNPRLGDSDRETGVWYVSGLLCFVYADSARFDGLALDRDGLSTSVAALDLVLACMTTKTLFLRSKHRLRGSF